jgi:hypothetical protein
MDQAQGIRQMKASQPVRVIAVTIEPTSMPEIY